MKLRQPHFRERCQIQRINPIDEAGKNFAPFTIGEGFSYLILN